MGVNSGFWGRLLRVNLTYKTSSVEEISDELLKKYIGGAALGSKLLYDELKPGIDPLGVENKIIYTCGPVTGTDTPCASRLNIATKSPLTGTITNSLSGGYFPVELKWTGFDAVIIEGKAVEPTLLVIKNDEVTFRSAKKLWGLNTFDTQLMIKEMLHDQSLRISCIGPAGEKLSLMSAIINEARAAGRKGVGAVMGSKNLKAVVVRGTNKVPIANKELFNKGVSKLLKGLKESPMAYSVFSKYGSSCAMEPVAGMGCFPHNNWQSNDESIDWMEMIGPYTLEKLDVGTNPCYRCPVACSRVRVAKRGRYAGISTEGPEFETMYSLGSVIGVTDPNAVVAADRLCDELGLDTISAGVAIGMAMELIEKDIIKDEDNLGLAFGNDNAAMLMLRNLAYREGYLGSLFADGTKRASETIANSDHYAMQVKGLELPAYDVRGFKAHGLNYATCYTGADHNKGYSIQEVFGIPVPHPVERLEYKGKGKLTKFNQDFAGLFDTVTFCEFPAIFVPEIFQQVMAEIISGASGWEFTAQDMWDVGERLNNLCRMFNIREGFSRKDDTLPKRLMTEPLKFGLSKGEFISPEDFNFMLDEYYEARGWDRNGMPTPERLKLLGLEETISALPCNNGNSV